MSNTCRTGHSWIAFCQLCVVKQGLFPFTTSLCTPKKLVGPSECGNLFTGLYFNHSRILTIRPLDQTSLDPRPFWPHKEGSGEYARKCLAGMPRLLNPSNCIFISSMWFVGYQVLLHPLLVISRTSTLPHWLADVALNIAALKTLPGKITPQTLPHAARNI